MSDFIKGITIKPPHQNAPSFVKGKVSFKVEDVIAALRENQNSSGYVNADLKESKDGKLYLQLDTYQKDQSGPLW